MRTVGGSMVARICRVSKWGGPLSAYFEMTADTEAPRSSAMGRGKALEASVLALWAEREGREVVAPSLVSSGQIRAASMPYAHATIDAFAREEMGVWRILEAKTLALEHAGPDWGEDGSDKVAAEYHLQALWYLGVCRAAGLDVVPEVAMPVLVGPEAELAWAARLVERSGRPLTHADLEGTGLSLRVYRVPWDEALFLAVDARVRSFLAEHVEKGVPPAPSEGDVLMDRDTHAVAHGFHSETGRSLEYERLSSAEREQVDELLEATRQRKAWEKAEEQARCRVQLAMGTAEEVWGCPDGARVTWKSNAAGGRRFLVRESKR